MSDPFDALRMPATPADPDPRFTAALRARVERALHLPRGVDVSTTTLASETAASATPQPTGPLGAAVPYLAVRDGREALQWYADVLGARVVGDPIVMPDGKVGHAELALGSGVLYLADEFPDIGVRSPEPDAASVSLVLYVPDVDAAVAAAVAAGGRLTREPYDAYGSRNATVVDPFGHRWMLETPVAAAPAASASAYREGDLGYASLWVPNVDRAADFYAAVVGWSYAAGSAGEGRRIEGRSFPMGVWGEQERGTLFCCYAVDDVDAGVERVRAAGGQADAPVEQPYGLVADCVDDQGVRFALVQAPSGGRPPEYGAGQGDLGYVTYEVVDSAKARAFYGSVLGWRFTPGSIDDGWQVEDAAPMSGLSGGHARATTVPMWRVDDLAAALDRLQAAGGTATEPRRAPYGLMAECADDQGIRFYLWQA